MEIGREQTNSENQKSRFKMPLMSKRTLHVSGLLLATGVLAFDLQMPPRFAATLIYLFVVVLGLRRSLAESKRFLKCALECLDSHIAILDDQGKILMVNSSWNPFTRPDGSETTGFKTGTNFLELCEAAKSEDWPVPEQLIKGIRRVITNRGDEFRFEYTSRPDSEEEKWFAVRVTRFEQEDDVRIVVAHDDITEFKQVESAYLGEIHAARDESPSAEKLMEEVAHEFA